MELRPEEITKIIKSQIKNYENHIVQEEVGTVLVVGDGIARASGLEKCMMNELLEFPNGEYGIAQNLEENTVAVIILGDDGGIKEGDTVRRTGRVVSVPVGEALHRPCRQCPRCAHRWQRPGGSRRLCPGGKPGARHHRASARYRAASDRYQGHRQR